MKFDDVMSEEGFSTPKVSVIVPVFNALPFLHECLDTIQSQTLEEIEIICVDDGSTDGSFEELEKRAHADNRIKVFKQNGGAGAARNLGLDNAVGEYILFLDSDDFFDDNLCDHTYRRAKETNADIVLFDGREYDQQLKEVREGTNFLRPLHLPNKEVFSPHDIPDHIFQVTSPSPWSKLFRREFISENDLRFQCLPNSNDVFMTFSSMAVASRISTIDEDLLRYRVNTFSSSQDGKWANPLCFLRAFSALESKLIDLGLYEEFQNSFLLAALRSSRHNLTTVTNYDVRMEILDAIESGEFLKTSLLRDADDYPSKATRTRGLYLKAALRQRDSSLRAQEFIDVNIVDSHEGERAVNPLLSLVIIGNSSKDDLLSTIESLDRDAFGPEEMEVIIVASDDIAEQLSSDMLDGFARTIVSCGKGRSRSKAISIGLNALTGEYAYLVEAGDMLDPERLDAALSIAAESRLDLVWVGEKPFGKEIDEKKAKASEMTNGKALLGELVRCHCFNEQLSNCLFKSDLGLAVIEGDPSSEPIKTFRMDYRHFEATFIFSMLALSKRAWFSEKCPVILPKEDRDGSKVLEDLKTENESFGDCLGYSLSAFYCTQVIGANKQSWDSASLDYAMRLISSISSKAVSIYRSMPTYERGGHVSIDALDEHIFKLYVSTPAQLLKKKEELSLIKERSGRAKKKNNAVHRSENMGKPESEREKIKKKSGNSIMKRLRKKLAP